MGQVSKSSSREGGERGRGRKEPDACGPVPSAERCVECPGPRGGTGGAGGRTAAVPSTLTEATKLYRQEEHSTELEFVYRSHHSASAELRHRQRAAFTTLNSRILWPTSHMPQFSTLMTQEYSVKARPLTESGPQQ